MATSARHGRHSSDSLEAQILWAAFLRHLSMAAQLIVWWGQRPSLRIRLVRGYLEPLWGANERLDVKSVDGVSMIRL